VRSQNSGSTDNATRASFQFSTNINAAIPATTSTFAVNGSSAGHGDILQHPTSLITRMTRSPVREVVWKERTGIARGEKDARARGGGTRFPICANPTVCQ
jgi:hypothetical protein